GEPSVPTVVTLQPSVFAPWVRIGPWMAQASTPQLMNVIFLPVGIGFLIGVVCVIVVGRVWYLLSTCCAAATFDEDEPPLDEPLDVLLLLLPQPAATSMIAASAATRTTVTCRRPGAARPGVLDMGVSSRGGCWGLGCEIWPTAAPSVLLGQRSRGCDARLVGAGDAGAVDARPSGAHG